MPHGEVTYLPRTAGRRAFLALAALILAGEISVALAAITQVRGRRDLEFGSTAPDGTIATTAIVDTAGAKSVAGGAFDLGGTITSGRFRNRGSGNSAYSCSLPASATLTSGGNTVTVDSITTNSALVGTLPGNGRVNFLLGGTLQLAAAQAAGAYTGTLTMTCDGVSDVINLTATVGTALSITNTASLDFGIVAPTGVAGTVTMSAAGVRSSANVTLIGGAPTAASFSVTGQASQAYSITYPVSAALTGPGTDLTLNAFTDDNPVPALSAAGAGTFNVGATVSVGATQASGAYIGNFAVTVNYQ